MYLCMHLQFFPEASILIPFIYWSWLSFWDAFMGAWVRLMVEKCCPCSFIIEQYYKSSLGVQLGKGIGRSFVECCCYYTSSMLFVLCKSTICSHLAPVSCPQCINTPQSNNIRHTRAGCPPKAVPRKIFDVGLKLWRHLVAFLGNSSSCSPLRVPSFPLTLFSFFPPQTHIFSQSANIPFNPLLSCLKFDN